MSTAQTEAREILGEIIALYHPELIDRIAAALAAKDAELAEVKETADQIHADWVSERDSKLKAIGRAMALEAQLVEANKALEQLVIDLRVAGPMRNPMCHRAELADEIEAILIARRVRDGGKV